MRLKRIDCCMLHLLLALAWSSPALGEEDADDVVYGPAVELARLEDPAIDESSGLARCHSRDDALWTHNDSGDAARLFLIGVGGRTLGTAMIDGVKPFDWEDMCSFRRNGKSYLLIGDIGDNLQRRSQLTLCLVEEPDAGTIAPSGIWRLQPAALIALRLEGGPHDCEAMAVDSATGSILLAGKSLADKCRIYRADWEWLSGHGGPALALATQTSGPAAAVGTTQTLIAKKIALADIPFATGMDVSADGRRAVIVSYVGAYEFTRRDGEEWATAFARPPRVLRMPMRRKAKRSVTAPTTAACTSRARAVPSRCGWCPPREPQLPNAARPAPSFGVRCLVTALDSGRQHVDDWVQAASEHKVTVIASSSNQSGDKEPHSKMHAPRPHRAR